MSSPPDEVRGFDQDAWDRRWSRVLNGNEHAVDRRPPNAHLLSEVAGLSPGRALDAGSGHGAETMWLAERGWRVTAVDFSAKAQEHARSRAEDAGPDIAGRIDWVTADLSTWTPAAGRFDLVVCLYVHVAGSVVEMIDRLAGGVAVGGELLMVGHRQAEPRSDSPTDASRQVQVRVEDARAALDPESWELLTCEDRTRARAADGVDVVVHARRLT